MQSWDFTCALKARNTNRTVAQIACTTAGWEWWNRFHFSLHLQLYHRCISAIDRECTSSSNRTVESPKLDAQMMSCCQPLIEKSILVSNINLVIWPNTLSVRSFKTDLLMPSCFVIGSHSDGSVWCFEIEGKQKSSACSTASQARVCVSDLIVFPSTKPRLRHTTIRKISFSWTFHFRAERGSIGKKLSTRTTDQRLAATTGPFLS